MSRQDRARSERNKQMREAQSKAREATVTLTAFSELADAMPIEDEPEPIAQPVEEAKEIPAPLIPLTLYKQSDGRLRVVGWASNNRRDNDTPPEIITDAAHKEFMAYLDANPAHAPEFWHWHTPGTRYAKADVWDYTDGFTFYSGLVDEGKEKQAQNAAREGIGMSHGFHSLGYDPATHCITKYRTFEVSDLPKSRAANPYTSFNVIRKEAQEMFSEAKKQYLLERLAPDVVAELEKKSGELKAAADAAGIEAKELEDAPVIVAVKAVDEKPKDEAKPEPDKDADEARIQAEVEKRLAAMGKSLNESVGETVKGIIAPLVARIESAENLAKASAQTATEAVEAAHKSLDEQVAEMIGAKPLRKGFKPTSAASTKVNKDSADATPVEEPTLKGKPGNTWSFEDTITKQLQSAY